MLASSIAFPTASPATPTRQLRQAGASDLNLNNAATFGAPTFWGPAFRYDARSPPPAPEAEPDTLRQLQWLAWICLGVATFSVRGTPVRTVAVGRRLHLPLEFVVSGDFSLSVFRARAVVVAYVATRRCCCR
jgi:hypothetical protein